MKRILVCLDGSRCAEDVIDAASYVARMAGARLTMFRAVGPPHELPPEAANVSPDRVQPLLEAQARRYLEHASIAIPRDLVESLCVKTGVPWEAIVEAARERDVDLIAIGSHGYGGIDRLLGTTAAKVVNHADRAVLVVRSVDRFTD